MAGYRRPYNIGPEKQWMSVINVNPAKKEVQGRLRDGGSIAVSLFEFPPAFRWPEEGEIWTVEKDKLDATHWILGSRVHHQQLEEETPAQDLAPGQMRLDSSVIYDRLGRRLLHEGENGFAGINVEDYGALGNGTDQQVALQNAINALPVNGGVLVFPKIGGDYRYSGQLDLTAKRQVIFQGQGAKAAGLPAGTVLYHTGSGSGSAILARGLNGVTFIDMWISYSNSAFSGKLINADGWQVNEREVGTPAVDTAYVSLVRCKVGSGASAPYNAIGLSLNRTIGGVYIDTIFSGNKRGVQGKATNNSYSNTHNFYGCKFMNSDEKHVMNTGEEYSFHGGFVEQLSPGVGGSAAGFIGYDPGFVQHGLAIENVWMGDVTAGTTSPQITFAGDGLKVSGCRIASGGSAPAIEVKPPTTTLSADPGTGGTTLTVADTHSTFGDSGTVLIGSEEIIFTGRTSTTITGCTRGANGTTPAAHSVGATVTFFGETQGIEIDAATYFHYCTYGVALRRGVKASSYSIRARGKLHGGSGAITAVALWEQDTAEDSVVHYIGAAGEPAFQGAWINNDNAATTPGGGLNRDAGFYKDREKVTLTGLIRAGASASVAFTLPVGYRPKANLGFVIAAAGTGLTGELSVAANGNVSLTSSTGSVVTFARLDGVSFRAFG